VQDQGLVENFGGSEDGTDASFAVSGIASGSAVAAVGDEVDHVASCGWPYASACPHCFPPFVLKGNAADLSDYSIEVSQTELTKR
jgi:hypothetical protein